MFRVLQAVTGALVFPNALALIREFLPQERRGTAFGMLGSAIGVAAAAGPPLGGLLVGIGGWRAIFLVNLPCVAAAVSVGFSNLALYATVLAVPLLLAGRPGWSAGEIGVAVAALSVPMFALSPLGGWLSDRAGRRAAAVIGLSLMPAGLLPLAAAGEGVSGELLLGSLALVGTGSGYPTPRSRLRAWRLSSRGMPASPRASSPPGRYLGGIAAASLVAALVSGAQADYGTLFAIASAAALLSTLLAFALPGRAAAQLPDGIGTRAWPT